MKKWRNLRSTELGKYKVSTIVLAVALAAMILWQGAFAVLGGADAAAARARLGLFADLPHDGLQTQRTVAWEHAVQNPLESGGVWGRFWTVAPFGGGGTE